MNRNDSGKYRQISKTVTMISASGLSPKKLIASLVTPICTRSAFADPENGSNKITQAKATAITGAT